MTVLALDPEFLVQHKLGHLSSIRLAVINGLRTSATSTWYAWCFGHSFWRENADAFMFDARPVRAFEANSAT